MTISIISSPPPPHLLQYRFFSVTAITTTGIWLVKMNVHVAINVLGEMSNGLRGGSTMTNVLLLPRLQLRQLGLMLGLPFLFRISFWNVGDGCWI